LPDPGLTQMPRDAVERIVQRSSARGRRSF
jgi:hypothetical protein